MNKNKDILCYKIFLTFHYQKYEYLKVVFVYLFNLDSCYTNFEHFGFVREAIKGTALLNDIAQCGIMS